MSDKTSIDFELKFIADDLKKGVAAAKGDLKDLRAAFEQAFSATAAGRGGKYTKEIKEAREQVKALINEVKTLQRQGAKNLNVDVSARKRSQIMGGAAQAEQSIRNAAPANIATKQRQEQTKADRELAQAERDLRKAEAEREHGIRTAVFQNEELAKSAVTLRYALYDVSSAATMVGQSFIGMSTAIVKAGMDQETSFTQVEKTLGALDPSKVAQLREELVKLSTEIPLSFDEISRIAMLGSQMGVSEAGLASFADTVAKFSAVTGMSADSAAEGFGKISSLLRLMTADGKVNGDAMEALGSAIFAVGVESAATEEQIISTTKQIAAVATAAGLSAGQVVGLASAFASMGIAPEESRGVIVQLFNEISKASSSYIGTIGKGSEELQTFTEIAQNGLNKMSGAQDGATISQEQFAAAWKNKADNVIDWSDGVTNATEAFQAFSAGLDGYDIPKTLAKINLDGVRTSKGLSTLAGGFGILASQMELATSAGEAATALNEAYAKKSDDLASKIQTLANSFDALLATISDSGASAVIGAIVDALRFLVNGFRTLQKATGPVGGVITTILFSLGALVGIIGLVVGVMTKGYASFLAFKTAIANAAIAGHQFNGVLGRITLMLAGVDVAALEAAGAIGVLSAAEKTATVATNTTTTALKVQKTVLASTGWGILLLILGSVVAGFMDTGDAATEAASGGLSDFQQAVVDAANETSTFRDEIQRLFDAVTDTSDGIRGLESAEYSLGKAAQGVAGDFQTNTQALREYENQVGNTVDAAVQAYGNNQQVLGEWLTQYSAFLIQNGLATEQSIQDIQDRINALISGGLYDPNLMTTTFNFQPILDGLNNVENSTDRVTGKVMTLLEKIQEALRLLNAKSTMRNSMRELGGTLEEVGKSFDTMTEAGTQNLASLNTVIEDIVKAADQSPQKTANRLGALRRAMWMAGVTSRTAFIAIDKAIATTGKKAQVAGSTVAEYFKLITDGMMNAVEKNVRSIRDWANDISDVMSNALDIRFEKQTAIDNITSGWEDMSSAVQDANDSIKKIKNTIDDLDSNKNVLEYQLKIAKKYGDSLREAAIQAELDKVNMDLADSQKELAARTDETNKTLTGQSVVAGKNRAEIIDMVQTYQDYLKTIAATTTDQDELSRSANAMRADFISQAKGLGFAESELQAYADAISVDFITATKNIPKDITLELAGTDPIIAAIASFVSRANSELDKIDVIDINGNTISVNANAGARPIVSMPGSAPATGAIGYSGGTGSGSGAGAGSGGTPSSGVPAITGIPGTGAGAGVSPGVYTPGVTGIPGTGAGSQLPFYDPFSTYVRGVKHYIELFRNSEKLGAKYALLSPEKTSDGTVNMNAYTKEQAFASRKNKLIPSSTAIAKFHQGQVKYLNEVKHHESLDDFARMWNEFGHRQAIKKINSDYGLKAFVERYGVGYATGGLVTGPGSNTSDSIPARLSNNEFVIQANAVKHYGADFMNALNSMKIPMLGSSGSGSGSNVVYLSPDDRALLRAAIDRPISLYTENTKIAQSANIGNVELARRGVI